MYIMYQQFIFTGDREGSIQLFQLFNSFVECNTNNNYGNRLRLFCRIVIDCCASRLFFYMSMQLLQVQFTPPSQLCFCFEYSEAMNNFACFTHANVLMCFRNFLIIYSRIIVEPFNFLDCQRFDIEHVGPTLQAMCCNIANNNLTSNYRTRRQ